MVGPSYTMVETGNILKTSSSLSSSFAMNKMRQNFVQEKNNLKDYRDVKIEFFGQNWSDLSQALLDSEHFNIEKI